MSTNQPSPFTVVGELIYDSENDELYRPETIYDDDLYWLNQCEADDYQHEDEGILDDEVDEPDFEPDFDDRDDFGDYGPGVDDFDPSNSWGID